MWSLKLKSYLFHLRVKKTQIMLNLVVIHPQRNFPLSFIEHHISNILIFSKLLETLKYGFHPNLFSTGFFQSGKFDVNPLECDEN